LTESHGGGFAAEKMSTGSSGIAAGLHGSMEARPSSELWRAQRRHGESMAGFLRGAGLESTPVVA
jgi:hypothetical protein